MQTLAFHSFQILTRPRINANDVAFVDEDRCLEFAARFGLDRFFNVGRGVAFGSRLAVGHRQVDVIWRRHDDWLAVKESHLTIHVVLQINPVIANLFGRQFGLFEVFLVHENKRIALPIQELNIRFINVSFFERVVALERAVERGASQQVFQLADVHRVAFARLLEFHRGHDVGLAIDLNFQAFAKVLCFVRHGSDPAVWIGMLAFETLTFLSDQV